MPAELEVIEAQALGLSAPDRARLLERLILSLDQDAASDQAWDDLAAGRDAEIESGQVSEIDGPEAIARLRPALETLAPAKDRGWGHVGPSGAGHFVKMVHNGIEYGMMQAFAEGFAIMKKKRELSLDLAQIADVWRHGSVVRSWLLDLTAEAIRENPTLEGIEPYVTDSGEGRWTVAEAIDLDVPAPVITLSLIQRLRSRDKESFPDRLLSMMRNKFGGHAVKKS